LALQLPTALSLLAQTSQSQSAQPSNIDLLEVYSRSSGKGAEMPLFFFPQTFIKIINSS